MRLVQEFVPLPSTFRVPAIPCLVEPESEGLDAAIASLPRLGQHGTLSVQAGLSLCSPALVRGIPVPELSFYLETACRRAAADANPDALAELRQRACLVRGLLSYQGRDILLQLCGAEEEQLPSRFGYWLTRLQAAWYAGEPAAALAAVHQAALLHGPATPVCDLLLFHVFASLAFSCSGNATAAAALRCHTDALRFLDRRFRASGGAIGAFADAMLARCERDPLAALQGFEQVAAIAERKGMMWLAALACEEAARQAADCQLVSVQHTYRQRTALCYRRWGALGHPAAAQAGAGEAGTLDSPQALGVAIAHEVNQPLAAITLHAVAARRWLRRSEPDIERALASIALIGAAGRQAGEVVRGMQRLALGQQHETGSVLVDGAIEEAVQLLRRPLRKHRIHLALSLGLGNCSMAANAVQLQQLVSNLVVNAIEAHAGSGAEGRRCIRIETRRHGACDIELAVTDNGPGIPQAYRGQVFTRQFSTKPGRACKAAGMGLAISLAIARAHGGHIWYEACEPQGACFRLRLPLDAAPLAGAG